ncbi:MAG TPA: phage minor head protein [Chiayiivirga sp.]|nr:phage minor head protein [Chiayiivirga sp.]
MPDIRIASRPFAEQVAFFQRKVSVPTGGWWDLQRADHAHGFMVAGAFKLDLLDDLRSIVQGAIERGTPISQFRKEFDAIVQRHGWTGWKGEGSDKGRAWRTRVIYETNIRQSYNAGRIAQLTSPAMVQARPYWQYRHNDKGYSKNPRPMHQKWDGTILRWDDPWWKTHAPMNGWGCKCGIRALSQEDLKALGKDGPDAAPNDGSYNWTAPDGVTHEIPNGIDPGFDYNVGAEARSLPAARRFGERVMTLPKVWRTRALEDAMRHVRDWYPEADTLINDIVDDRFRPRGRTMSVGMLHPAAADYLDEIGRPPDSAMVGLTDYDVGHLWRDSKLNRGSGFPEHLLRTLPLALAQPDAVLFDLIDPALIYAWKQTNGDYAKAVIRLDYQEKKGVLRREPTNYVRTGGLVSAADLTAGRYRLLAGRVE